MPLIKQPMKLFSTDPPFKLVILSRMFICAFSADYILVVEIFFLGKEIF